MSTNNQPNHESTENVYTANGYRDRAEYLDELAEGSSDPGAVYAIADMLGSNEDFDGLITNLEDFELI